MADKTADGPERLVSEDEWKRGLAAAGETRPDDTVVLSGGKRATREEFQAHVAADLARRAAAAADSPMTSGRDA